MSVSVADPSPRRASPRVHRLAVGVAIAISTLCVAVASFAVWLRQQALNTENWTNTSSQILANRTVQKAVGAYLTEQLFSSVNVAGELQRVLPNQVADAVPGKLQTLADGLAVQLLAQPAVQQSWRSANRTAQLELLDILDGGDRVVSTRQGVVTLNLHPLVGELARALSGQSVAGMLPSQLRDLLGSDLLATAQRLLDTVVPPQSGQLVVWRSSRLRTAQNVVKGIRGLSIALPIAALAMFGLAVTLAGGWRRVVLRRIGWSLIAAGIAVLVARRLLETLVVNALLPSPTYRPAGDVVWSIGTSVLRDIALLLIVGGAVVAITAIVASLKWPAGVLRD